MARATSLPPLFRPGWIVAAVFMFNPLWWVLGFGDFAWCFAAVPLWIWIIQHRNLKLPPTTGLFVLYVVWALVTVIKIDRFTRVLSFGFRYTAYLTALGLAIYVYNERRITRARFIRWVAWFWVAAVIGGYIGLILPNARLNTTVASVLLPKSVSKNDFVGNLVRPGFAQVQNLFGVAIPRPKTLFSFTNEWGGNLGLLTPFFISSFLFMGTRKERKFGVIMMIVAIPPMVISVNRGLWLSLIIMGSLTASRDFLQGRTKALKYLTGTVILVTVLLALTPLGTIIGGRLSESDASAREGIYGEAWRGAVESPIFGFGGPRPSENPFSPPIGTHGQVWLVMFSHGFVGLAMYGAWAFAIIWRCWQVRDRVSMLLSTVTVIAVLQAFIYNLLPTSIPIILTAVGLVMRGPDSSEERTVIHRLPRSVELRPRLKELVHV
jgi:polysaccharide biosynthesis protein PslJ